PLNAKSRIIMNTTEQIESTIRALENKRYDAVMNKNLEELAKLAHPKLSYAHSSGGVDTLEEYLQKINTGFYVYKKIEHPIDSFTILNNIVLVRGEMNGEIIVGGEKKTLKNKTLTVWVYIAEEWRFLSYQPTPTIRMPFIS
ncbi:nuclear transport factor 2 family protein, partial [Pseudomonas sp. IPO3749]